MNNNQAAEVLYTVLSYGESCRDYKKYPNLTGKTFKRLSIRIQELSETYNRDFTALARELPTYDLFKLNNKEELREKIDENFLNFINALMCFDNDQSYDLSYHSSYYNC